MNVILDENHFVWFFIRLTIPLESFWTPLTVVVRACRLGGTPSVLARSPCVTNMLTTRAVTEVAGWARPAARTGRCLLALHSWMEKNSLSETTETYNKNNSIRDHASSRPSKCFIISSYRSSKMYSKIFRSSVSSKPFLIFLCVDLYGFLQ